MPKLAQHIHVQRRGRWATLYIDGEEFPYFISVDGVTVNVDPRTLPEVTFSIPADRVTVGDDPRYSYQPDRQDGKIHKHHDGGPLHTSDVDQFINARTQ